MNNRMKHMIWILAFLLLGCSDGNSDNSDDSGDIDTGDADDTGEPDDTGDTDDADDTGDVDDTGDTEEAIACTLDNVAWYKGNFTGVYEEVAQKLPNAYGLYDMLGNNIEWTADCWHDDFSSEDTPADGSVWSEDTCEYYVVRGGCYGLSEDSMRISFRGASTVTGYGGCKVGFRCVADTLPDTSALGELNLEWAEITGGDYEMGCIDGGLADCPFYELPVHDVTVPSFYIMTTEVTASDFETVTGENANVQSGCDTCAASDIQFAYAIDFCEAVGGRLPSEAEWEYAARGGTTDAYACGE